MEYLKAWAEGKLDVLVNPNNPLRSLSFPPVSKPIPYVYYIREEAEKGGCPEIEEELKNKMPKNITSKYPLVFIQSGSNLGFAGGNNLGIKYALAKNDFDSVILLNNDTVIKRDAISNLIRVRLSFGEKAIYGGRIFYYYEPYMIWYDGGKFNEWTGRAIHLNMEKLKTEIKNKQAIKEVNFITFCYVLIPKFILDKIGLLDESYFMYVEDLDYSYKVWKSGYKLYHVIDSEVWHKVGTIHRGDEFKESRAYWYYRNSLRFKLYKQRGYKRFVALLLIIPARLRIILRAPKLFKVICRSFLDAIKK
jgi:GT2 family glycosyltransferase